MKYLAAAVLVLFLFGFAAVAVITAIAFLLAAITQRK